MRPRTAQSLRGPPRSLGDIMKLGYFHQIRLLVSKGMDVECRDSYRRTPIILCAFMQPEEWAVSTAMTLIEQGVNVGERDCFGRNALHYASIYERPRLVRVLLRAIDFDLGQADTVGNTALHYAAMSGNATICQLLAQSFNKYRISARSVNRRGRTALEEALAEGHAVCARAIEFELTSEEDKGAVKDVRFVDDVALRSSLRSCQSQNGSLPTSERKLARPMSAALDRGHSAFSNSSAALDRGHSAFSNSSAALDRGHSAFSNNSAALDRGHSAFSNSSAALDRGHSAFSNNSAAIERGHSAFSNNSVALSRSPISLRIRSSSGTRTRGHRRKSQNPLYTNGFRRDDDIIYCAPEDDFRNKLDYVCKLANLTFDPQIWDHVSMLASANQNSSCWPDTCSTRHVSKRAADWRLELQQLFKVYEHQCSPSWRAARKFDKSTPTPASSPGPEDEDKGKKGKTLNNLSKNAQGKESSPELKRRLPSVRQRKTANGKLTSGTSVDGSLDTSSESIGSVVSSRRRGPEREPSAGRPDSSPSKPRPRLRPEPSPLAEPARAEIDASQAADIKESSSSNKSASNQGLTNPTTVPASVSAPPAPSISTQHLAVPAPPISTQHLAVPATKNPPPTGQSHKESSAPTSSSTTTTTLPKIKVVVDKLGDRDIPGSLQPHVDTSKLWVQNPYEESEEEDNGDDDGEEEDSDG